MPGELGQRRLLVAIPTAPRGQKGRGGSHQNDRPPQRDGGLSAALKVYKSCYPVAGPCMRSPTRRPSRPTNHVSGKPVLPKRPRLAPWPSNTIGYVSP